MAVPTPPQAFWSSGDEGTPDRLNWTMLQADTLGNRPSAHADINGVVYLSTSEIPPVLYQVQSGSWVSLSAIGGDEVVRKTADQTVNNSTTLVNDTHLLFAVGANEEWSFLLKVLLDGNGPADFKAFFTLPSGADLQGRASFTTPAGAVGGDNFGVSAYETTPLPISGPGSPTMGNGKLSLVLHAIVMVAGTAGNVQFQWAQNTADSSDTKVMTDSMIVKRRIA
jgi:hypothetical protein